MNFAPWMPYLLLFALTFGILVGSFIRFGLDRAELAAYRRAARSIPPVSE